MKVEQIIELMKAVSDTGLTDFSYEENGVTLKMKKHPEGHGKAGAMPPMMMPMMPGMPPMAGMPQPMAAPAEGTSAASGYAVEVSGQDAPEKEVSGNVMNCPLVGTFYSASSPDAEDYVKVGDTVKKGQVLGIVEAMKLMNEIESEFDGVVKAILVENGDLVEYGQKMFIIG